MDKNEEPVRLALRQMLSVSNLEIGPEAAGTADVELTGGLEGAQKVFAPDLRGTIGPISDPEAMTFDISGDVANLAPSYYEAFLQKHEIQCEGMELQLRLQCDRGDFDPQVSRISVLIKNVILPDDLAKAMPGRVNTFEELTIPLGVSGRLTSPQVDSLPKALLRGTLENVSKNKELRGALEKEAGKLIKKLID